VTERVIVIRRAYYWCPVCAAVCAAWEVECGGEISSFPLTFILRINIYNKYSN
jgi:hypothetical protein